MRAAAAATAGRSQERRSPRAGLNTAAVGSSSGSSERRGSLSSRSSLRSSILSKDSSRRGSSLNNSSSNFSSSSSSKKFQFTAADLPREWQESSRTTSSGRSNDTSSGGMIQEDTKEEETMDERTPRPNTEPSRSRSTTAASSPSNDSNEDKENNLSEKEQVERAEDSATRSTSARGEHSFRSSEEESEHNTSSLRKVLRNLNKARIFSGKVINNNKVQFFIVILITINAIMMGIATFDFVKSNPKVRNAFETTDMVFLIIFTVELAMQLIYHGWRLFLDGWLVFDFVIIIVSWTFSEVQIIRAFRIFRALRLITRIKVMKNLLLALFSVMPRMTAIGLLLLLIFYIFAVMCTALFKDLYHDGETDYDYFSRLDSTFLTLFQLMTLDNWADVSRQVMAVFSWAWLPILTFVIISGFVVVNLIIAVICDAIAALNDDDKNKLSGVAVEEGDSEATPEPVDVREKLEALEGQVEELVRLQEQTMKKLRFLAENLVMDEK